MKFAMRNAGHTTLGSHPTGVRGLKYIVNHCQASGTSRTPLGCVD